MTAALAGFAVAATLLILAPGPDSMLVLRNTLRGGRRAGWVTAGGTLSGLLVWAAAAAFGLSAVLQASTIGYDVLRAAGAGYLAWLGVTNLGLFHNKDTKRRTDQAGQPFPTEANQASWGRMYLNLLNPKIGIFFIAFLPSFIRAGPSATALSFSLGLWFVAETGAWLAALAWLAARGVQWLRRSAIQRWLERATGIVLIGFAVRLALESRLLRGHGQSRGPPRPHQPGTGTNAAREQMPMPSATRRLLVETACKHRQPRSRRLGPLRPERDDQLNALRVLRAAGRPT